jgi:hypothetical protein
VRLLLDCRLGQTSQTYVHRPPLPKETSVLELGRGSKSATREGCHARSSEWTKNRCSAWPARAADSPSPTILSSIATMCVLTRRCGCSAACSMPSPPAEYMVTLLKCGICYPPESPASTVFCDIADTLLQILPIARQVSLNERIATGTTSKHISALPVSGYTHVAAGENAQGYGPCIDVSFARA